MLRNKREQRQLLQWALKGFPESQVEAENRRLNKLEEMLKARKTELEAQVKDIQNASINVPNLERFIEDMQKKITGTGLQRQASCLGYARYNGMARW